MTVNLRTACGPSRAQRERDRAINALAVRAWRTCGNIWTRWRRLAEREARTRSRASLTRCAETRGNDPELRGAALARRIARSDHR